MVPSLAPAKSNSFHDLFSRWEAGLHNEVPVKRGFE